MAAHIAEALLHNALGQVSPCACGGITLSMGPVSLHFTHHEIDELMELATAGRNWLHEAPPQRRAPQTRRSRLKAHGTLH